VNIIADENIPYAHEAFGTLGDVRLVSGRDVTPDLVRDCDLLFIRSVTRTNAALLDGSRVRFVATATIGTDHVDLDYLAGRGTGFASAPGSNATSVAEYIAASLLVLARDSGTSLEGKTLGVVGVGNVGSRVVAKAEAMGMRVLQNDPPVQRETGDPRYLPLDALFEADFITLHVPLTREGQDATLQLADEAFLARMRPGSVLLNTSRGAVVDGNALKAALASGHLGEAVLDVWEGEPDIDMGLLAKVAIGTPHIAGYSFDGKVRATEMIYAAACESLGVEPTWSAADAMPEPDHPRLEIDCAGWPDEDVLRAAVLTVYDIEADNCRLRQFPEGFSARPAYFDRLRKEYPKRREFENTVVTANGASEALARKLGGLGFQFE
jgi:erythronate-4-phosphate dehydrogenase